MGVGWGDITQGSPIRGAVTRSVTEGFVYNVILNPSTAFGGPPPLVGEANGRTRFAPTDCQAYYCASRFARPPQAGGSNAAYIFALQKLYASACSVYACS